MKMYTKARKDLQEHSKLKIKLYEKVLNEFVPVFLKLNYINKVIICEPFAGPGVHSDNTPGSPLVAFNTISVLNRAIPNNKSVSLWLNEHGKKEYNTLSEKIGKYANVKIENKLANDYLQSLLTNELFKKSDTQKIIFLDPYGYSEKSVASYETIDKIINLKNTDILYFIPVSYIQRLASSSSKEALPVRKFLEWRSISPGFKSQEQMAEDIAKSFRDDGFFSFSFKLKAEKNNYFIFYIGSHIYGAEKFLNSKEKVELNNTTGDLFTEDILQDMMFNNYVKKCSDFFVDTLKDNMTNKEIFKLGIKNGFRASVQKKALENLQKCGSILIYSMNNELIRKPRGFYLNWENYRKNPRIRVKWS